MEKKSDFWIIWVTQSAFFPSKGWKNLNFFVLIAFIHQKVGKLSDHFYLGSPAYPCRLQWNEMMKLEVEERKKWILLMRNEGSKLRMRRNYLLRTSKLSTIWSSWSISRDCDGLNASKWRCEPKIFIFYSRNNYDVNREYLFFYLLFDEMATWDSSEIK